MEIIKLNIFLRCGFYFWTTNFRNERENYWFSPTQIAQIQLDYTTLIQWKEIIFSNNIYISRSNCLKKTRLRSTIDQFDIYK